MLEIVTGMGVANEISVFNISHCPALVLAEGRYLRGVGSVE